MIIGLDLRKVLVVVMLFTVRKFIDRHVVAGSTVNLCAVDLSKAFDKVT